MRHVGRSSTFLVNLQTRSFVDYHTHFLCIIIIIGVVICKAITLSTVARTHLLPRSENLREPYFALPLAALLLSTLVGWMRAIISSLVMR
jgi:hypothetical protein